MEVSTDGNIRPCCKFRGSVGNAHKDDLPSVMAGTKLQLLRQQFLQGQRSGSCQICWDQEDTGTTSIRHHSLTKYEEQSEYDDVDSPVVRDLTIAPSNVCNFTCRICNHTNSSAIAAENLAVSTEDSQRQMFRMYLQGSHLVPDDVYQSMINDISPTLHMLHLLGGEPLLHKNLPKWLDLIISSGHADHIDIEINSNGSVWNDRLIELLQKFHSVQILLSIDDIGARFELQRGGSWSEVDRNTRLWAAQQNDTFQVDVTPAVSLQNLLYLDDLVTYVQTLGLGLVWFYVDGPSHWSIDNATSHMRDLAITRYQNHPHAELRAIAERLRTIKGTNGRAFVSAVNALDLRRSQRFADAHAEAWQAMTAAQNPSQTIDHSVTIDL